VGKKTSPIRHQWSSKRGMSRDAVLEKSEERAANGKRKQWRLKGGVGGANDRDQRWRPDGRTAVELKKGVSDKKDKAETKN